MLPTMPRTKVCIICQKPHANSMSKCCWPKCQNKYDKQRYEDKRDKAKDRINVSIQGIEDDVRELAREDIRKVIEPYLKNKKLTIKVGRGKVRTDYQKLKDRLDVVFAKYIRERDNNTCVICGSTENPNNGHLFSCVNTSTRWDEINCNCQCASCNILHEANPHPYINWFKNNYGEAMYEDLEQRWHGKPIKTTTMWLSEKIEYYNNLIKTL